MCKENFKERDVKRILIGRTAVKYLKCRQKKCKKIEIGKEEKRK